MHRLSHIANSRVASRRNHIGFRLGDIGAVAMMRCLICTRIPVPCVPTGRACTLLRNLLTSLNLSGTGLTLEAAPVMLGQLCKFSVLTF